jgi:hypothetical protein
MTKASERKIRKQFGRKPNLSAVLIWAAQQALRCFGAKHSDSKRQRTTKLRDVAIQAARELKREHNTP